MRVVLVTTNLRGGGAEKALLRWSEALLQHGHRVELVLLEHLVDYDIPAGIGLHALTSPGIPCSKGWFGKRQSASRLHRLVTTLDQDSPVSLIVSTLPFADEVAVHARLRPQPWHRIANTLSVEVGRLKGFKACRRQTRYRRLYGGGNLIAVSQGVAEDLREALGVSGARIEVIYNPYNLAEMRRLAEAPVDGLADAPYVLHIGRFAPQKRHDLLFEAWQRLPTAGNLVLLTNPSVELSALIARYHLTERVIVAGFQRNPYPWIRRARLLVLCSDHEGLPNVLVEALACRTPVVSTDCPSGPREILGPALERWLVPCGDPARLADSIAEALLERPATDAVDLNRFESDAFVARIEALAGASRDRAAA